MKAEQNEEKKVYVTKLQEMISKAYTAEKSYQALHSEV